jgi:Opacity protein and related surface antigens
MAGDASGVYIAPKVMWSHQVSGSSNIESDLDTLNGPLNSATGVKKSDSKSTAGAGVAVGYDFSPQYDVPVRAEIEVSTRTQAKFENSGTDAGSGDIVNHTRKNNTTTVFANFYYDIDTGTEFTPYIGAGVGLASIDVKDLYSGTTLAGVNTASGSSNKTATNFAWNVSAGVACALDENWKLDLGYRYINFGTVKGAATSFTDSVGNVYTTKAKSDLSAHEVQMGLRYSF